MEDVERSVFRHPASGTVSVTVQDLNYRTTATHAWVGAARSLQHLIKG